MVSKKTEPLEHLLCAASPVIRRYPAGLFVSEDYFLRSSCFCLIGDDSWLVVCVACCYKSPVFARGQNLWYRGKNLCPYIFMYSNLVLTKVNDTSTRAVSEVLILLKFVFNVCLFVCAHFVSYFRLTYFQTVYTCLESTKQTKELMSARKTSHKQRRPEWLTVALTWHASTYKVRKLQQSHQYLFR